MSDIMTDIFSIHFNDKEGRSGRYCVGIDGVTQIYWLKEIHPFQRIYYRVRKEIFCPKIKFPRSWVYCDVFNVHKVCYKKPEVKGKE